ncbi:hypothetical protein [Treponema endosymbiont of Eucomonympha sp.]|uniref:hypothetical protein n=1 Tax=Treponema endosymbiont of Eucomonympha sp. TaxID=1580831 RepID=UPI0007801E3D|nr:hypothetical protein [Treponema endosymbiont of Eucomonympha sp.]
MKGFMKRVAVIGIAVLALGACSNISGAASEHTGDAQRQSAWGWFVYIRGPNGEVDIPIFGKYRNEDCGTDKVVTASMYLRYRAAEFRDELERVHIPILECHMTSNLFENCYIKFNLKQVTHIRLCFLE